MLNLKNVLEKTESIKEKLITRGFDVSIIDEVQKLGVLRSQQMRELELKKAEKNNISSKIGSAKRDGENVEKIMSDVSSLKSEIQELEEKTKTTNEKVKELLLMIPNIPSKETPVGQNDNDNKIIEEFDNLGRGKVEVNKPHYEIAEELDILDTERAVKISGSRFVAYKGLGSKLVRALKDFMLDQHTQNGYIEFTPPVLVNSSSLIGTGQLPKFADDLFKVENHDKWLIPTAEVPLTNLFSNEILDLTKTKSITAYTQCFRSEAGSGGKDNKGLIRLHQFNKVELVKITKPENAEKEFNNILADAENILQKLELPYRKVALCSGDLGFSANRTIDLEVWMPSENKYREISSISNFGDYQARRSMIRFKNESGDIEYAATLNGSGLAIDRCIAAILENYQNEDNTITIPKALEAYININKIG